MSVESGGGIQAWNAKAPAITALVKQIENHTYKRVS